MRGESRILINGRRLTLIVDSIIEEQRNRESKDKFIYLDDDDFIWMNGAIKKITHHRSFKDFAGASFQYLFCYPLGSVPFP